MPRLLILISTLLLVFNSFARVNTVLDSGWRFKRGDIRGAEAVNFNDTNWQTVSIPHNWGWEQAQPGKNYYRGPGWYRRDLPQRRAASCPT